MDKIEDKKDLKFARFSCDCLGHVLDITCTLEGPKEDEPWVEIFCNPVGYEQVTFWKRLSISFGYLIGRSKNHSFWDFILRPEDLKPFKEFIASLPDR